MGREKIPKNFEAITERVAKASVMVGICDIVPAPNNQFDLKNILSLGSGFFISKNGLLLTARHVLPLPLPPGKSIIAIQRIGTNWWASHGGTIKYDFSDLDVIAIQFQRKTDTIPLRQRPLNQGADIGAFGYPNSKIQFVNGSLVAPSTKGRVSKATIGNIEQCTLNFTIPNQGQVQIQSKVMIESQFIFVAGNSGGPVFSAKDGKVVGIVTGVDNIPQGHISVTVNQQNITAVPFANYSYAISIHEVLPRLSKHDFKCWW